MLNLCLIVIILFIILLILLLFSDKNLYNKILFLNSLTSSVALFICFLASKPLNDSYLDIAIIYFLLSFISTMSYLKYFVQQKNK